MKRLILTLIIVGTIASWNLERIYAQDISTQDPAVSASSTNLYHCPNHPEVTATWPAKCPKCGAILVRQEERQEPSTATASSRARAEEMRRRIMLNTSISVFDPEAILGAKKPLALTQEQINKLQAISLAAREGAKKILTEKQRRELTAFDNLSNYPKTMAEMHRRMLQGMPASNSMMLDMLLHQLRSRNFSASQRNSSAQRSDPPISSTLRSNNTRQASLDSFGDTGANAYRDQLRDNYRDQLRDRYRDFFRDQYRDSFGGFGGLGSSGFGEGFGNERFGEGLGNQGFGEGFGNEGFGEGFDNEGFGEGFGNEGFGGENFGNRGFGVTGSGNEGFGESGGRR